MDIYIVGEYDYTSNSNEIPVNIDKIFVNKKHAEEYIKKFIPYGEIFTFPLEDYFGTKLNFCNKCRKMLSKNILHVVGDELRCKDCLI